MGNKEIITVGLMQSITLIYYVLATRATSNPAAVEMGRSGDEAASLLVNQQFNLLWWPKYSYIRQDKLNSQFIVT